jgi:bifunctional DNA-binding transcriptional regulator/antitoxin component of YhaV-PrlF toxin-antitoxin module
MSSQKILLPKKFRELFDALPPDKVHPEVNSMVRAVISHYSPTEVDKDEDHWVSIHKVKTLKSYISLQYLLFVEYSNWV